MIFGRLRALIARICNRTRTRKRRTFHLLW